MNMRANLLVLGCLLAIAAGCGSTPASEPGSDDTLQPPAIGIQLTTKDTTIQPSDEQYACWSFTVPKDAPLDLVGLETQVRGAGVHHYAIFTDSSGAQSTEAYDCEKMGQTWGLVTGGGLGTPPVKFPDGTA